ncbi:MAG: elongation factor G [Myxococcota bacterium]
MKTDGIRNISLMGYDGAGKTCLAEALVKYGAPDRALKEIAPTRLDLDNEELKRNITLSTKTTFTQWKDVHINILDTPGSFNFLGETSNSIAMTEASVLVIKAAKPIRHYIERFGFIAEDRAKPLAVFINQCDMERANLDEAFSSLTQEVKGKHIFISYPIGLDTAHQGVVDVLRKKAYYYQGAYGKFQEKEIPPELKDKIEELHTQLVEVLAETDDELVNKYLEGATLTEDELTTAFKKGFVTRAFFPVFCGSVKKATGVNLLLDYVVSCFPDPTSREWPSRFSEEKMEMRKVDPNEPFSAIVFKTTVDHFQGKVTYMRIISGVIKADQPIYNSSKKIEEKFATLIRVDGKNQIPLTEGIAGDIVAVTKLKDTQTGDTLSTPDRPAIYLTMEFPKPTISFALKARTKQDEDKLSNGLQRLIEEDPLLSYTRTTDTKELLLSGMGQAHLEIAIERLRRKYEVDVTTQPPKVPYKETIKKPAKAQGKYKRQSGGRGQYGDCWLELKPLPRGKGFEFTESIFGGAIPKNYIPSIQKGVEDAMQEGPLAGYPVTDISVNVYDGSYHEVDSSDMAFKIAGSMGFKNAYAAANPVLLEPVMQLEIVIPEEFLGDVIGDINSRRGKIQGMDPTPRGNVVRALVPYENTATYATDLHSITQGIGYFTMEFSHMEEVPSQIAQKIIDAYQKQKGQQEEEK